MLHLCRCPRMRGKSQVPPSKNSFNNNFQIFHSSCPVSLEDTTVIFSNAPEFSLALSLPFSLLRFTNTLMSSGLCQCVSTALNLLSSVDPNGNFVNGNFVNFSQSIFSFLHSLALLIRSMNPHAQHSALGPPKVRLETAFIPGFWLLPVFSLDRVFCYLRRAATLGVFRASKFGSCAARGC